MTAIRTPDDEIDRPGYFYPPFHEGWTYQGATYAGHSDWAVDLNRRTPSGGWLSDEGDPVLAAADGTVAEVDKADGVVMLNHHGGLWRTEYRHMKDIVVKVGQKVQRGDRIGSIGNVAGDGRSFGAHLHHVHWKRDRATAPWRRVKMRIEDQPVGPSAESDGKPAGWTPPAAEMVVGPPPRATWESAFREALSVLAKVTDQRDAARDRVTLTEGERDAARAATRLAEATAAEMRAERDTARKALEVEKQLTQDLMDDNERLATDLAACRARTPDCTAAVSAAIAFERTRVLTDVSEGIGALLGRLA